MRNKKEYLEPLMRNNFDMFLVSKTKFDPSFPGCEFAISGYKLFRNNRNQHGVGLIFYMSQDILCKTIDTFSVANSLEVLPSESSLRNKKALVIGCCKPSSLNDEYFLDQLHGVL